MRSLCVLVVLAACSQQVPAKPFRPPPPMTVEDVATWFMTAALAGDQATARTLALRADQFAQLSKKAPAINWDAEVDQAIGGLAREGDGEVHQVRAIVRTRKTLTRAESEKILRDVEVAIVAYVVDGREAGLPFLFVKTDEGWRFSPKH